MPSTRNHATAWLTVPAECTLWRSWHSKTIKSTVPTWGAHALQIAQLERGLYEMKMGFNKQFLALREVKCSVVARLRTLYSQLNAITEEIGGAAKLPLPQMQPDEEPERREEVSEADIDAYLAQQDADAAAAASKTAGGGFGTFGGSAAARADGAAAQQAGAPGAGVAAPEVPQRTGGSAPLSPLEQAERAIRVRELVRTAQH